MKFKLSFDVKFKTISFIKKIIKPIKIDIKRTLKNPSFLLNFPVNPITTNPITIKKKGFKISDK